MVLNRLLNIPLARNDSQNSRNSATPEPSSPTGSSVSSGPDVEEDQDTDQSIHLPALASPTNLNAAAAPWPFGSVATGRERSLSNATTSTLNARRPSLGLEKPSPSALPHEILLAILKLVPSNNDLKSSILVCKSWCQCGVELLWHKPYISHPNALNGLLAVLSSPKQTFHYNDFIRRVNLSLLSTNIDDAVLVQLAPCRRMERLTLSGSAAITDRGLGYLLDHCQTLVALDLSDCTQLTDIACLSISKNCRRLQGLNLSGCKNLASIGITAIAMECRELRRVKLRSLENLADSGVAALAQSCPMLLELDLFGCTQITDEALQAVWRHLGHVRELTVNGAQITDESFPARDVNGQPSIRQPTYLAALKGDPNAKTFVAVPTSHFDHVRYLDLTSQVQLTDAAVESIVTFMPKVRNLILSKCTGLTDESINSICRLGKNLHYLHLSHVSQITDRSVVKLARQCTRLRYIDLACCTQLTDLSVFELALLPRLKRVGLVRVTNLTDDAVFALAERKSLERIHLSYCDRISVQAVHLLLQGLHHLTHLSLTGVPAFRQHELQVFCRPPPREFNTHQQSTFCVYSGRGVAELRQYLAVNSHMQENENYDEAGRQQRELSFQQQQRNAMRRQTPAVTPNNAAGAQPGGSRRRRRARGPQQPQADPGNPGGYPSALQPNGISFNPFPPAMPHFRTAPIRQDASGSRSRRQLPLDATGMPIAYDGRYAHHHQHGVHSSSAPAALGGFPTLLPSFLQPTGQGGAGMEQDDDHDDFDDAEDEHFGDEQEERTGGPYRTGAAPW